jgi:hypothetical protein
VINGSFSLLPAKSGISQTDPVAAIRSGYLGMAAIKGAVCHLSASVEPNS